MVHPSLIEARLGELGFKPTRWFNAEVRELEHILMDSEKIIALACGRYFGSFALLCATDQRLLLIDKRVFFMNIEDTRYDMISEIDFNSQVYSAMVTVHTINKTHKFTTMRYKSQLRDLTNYVQRRIFELRSQQTDTAGTPQPLINMINSRQPAARAPAPAQTYQYVPVEPRQMASQPADYYVDDKPDDGHVIRERVSHIAHVVGSAATSAVHHHPTMPRRPLNPYIQGSLVTRRQAGTRTPYNNYNY
jgi:hypothetical protein